MLQKKHHVTIKGTKEGLTFIFDDSCSFDHLIEELKEKLSLKHYQKGEGPEVQVYLNIGNRYLTEDQENLLKEIIMDDKNLIVNHIQSNVITKVEAERIAQKTQIVSVSKIIRSGQVLKITGDLLLIGDVNPGGTIEATGNIFVIGALRGIAFAGSEGDEKAIIAASIMAPSQLKISNYLHQEPDRNKQIDRSMECAYIDEKEGKIQLERVQQLPWLRPTLNRTPANAIH